MNIKKARKILSKESEKLTDKQLEEIMLSLSALADIFIEQQKGVVNAGK